MELTMARPVKPSDPSAYKPHQPIPHDVKKAVNFIRESAGRRISVSDLVAHCGVPARTLRKHFRRFLGVSPLEFWRRSRMTAARDDLLAAGSDTFVTDVAIRAGFNHFGRFAQVYRQLFGETPSTTLRRNRLVEDNRSGRILETVSNGKIDATRMFRRDRPSLTILPCQVSSADPECRYFAEYLTEGIATALCGSHSMSVVAPNSLRGTTSLNLERPGRRNTRYILAGRVAQSGERVRVGLRLIDGTTNLHIWGDIYESGIGNLFALQDRVAEALMQAIPPQIRGAEIERARRKLPQDLDAYDLVLRALPFVYAAYPDSAKRALDLLDRAIELDPDYAPATALAGWCHAQLVLYNSSPSHSGARLRALALSDRAGILDSDDPLVLTARAAVHTMAGQMSDADTLNARALALDPTLAWGWERSGWLNAYRGRPETAIRHFKQAIRLDPSALNANRLLGIGCAYFDAGHYEEAVLWKRRGLKSQPNTAWINRGLSVSYARTGNRLAALDSIDSLRRYSADLTISEIVSSIPFTQNFLDRIAEGLRDLGMPN
jgi:adenylate cyclase